MDPRSAAGAYVERSIESAPPIQLVRLLYQGAIRALDRALAFASPENASALRAEARPAFERSLARAEDIVLELRLCLRSEAAPELAHALESLYQFVEERIQAARRQGDPELLHACREVLAKLLHAWTALEIGPGVD